MKFKIGDKILFRHKQFIGSASHAFAAGDFDIRNIQTVVAVSTQSGNGEKSIIQITEEGWYYKAEDFKLISDTPFRKAMQKIADNV